MVGRQIVGEAPHACITARHQLDCAARPPCNAHLLGRGAGARRRGRRLLWPRHARRRLGLRQLLLRLKRLRALLRRRAVHALRLLPLLWQPVGQR